MWWSIIILKYLTAVAMAVTGIIASLYELSGRAKNKDGKKELTKWGKVNFIILLCSAPTTLLLQGLQDLNQTLSAEDQLLKTQKAQSAVLSEVQRAVSPMFDSASFRVWFVFDINAYKKDHPAARSLSAMQILRTMKFARLICEIGTVRSWQLADPMASLIAPPVTLAELGGIGDLPATLDNGEVDHPFDAKEKQLVVGTPSAYVPGPTGAVPGRITVPCTAFVHGTQVASLLDIVGMPVKVYLSGQFNNYFRLRQVFVRIEKPHRELALNPHGNPSEAVNGVIPPLDAWG